MTSEQEDRNAPCQNFAHDIYFYMRAIEKENSVRMNYLENQDLKITVKDRAILVDALVQLQERFTLTEETIFGCINILDRYLQNEARTTKKDLVINGATALFLACKVHEVSILTIDEVISSTGIKYTADNVRVKERHILKTVMFSLNTPNSMAFLGLYSEAGNVDKLVRILAIYFMELGLMDPHQLGDPPSHTAAAALYLSLSLMNPEASRPWNDSLQFYFSRSRTDKRLLTAIYRKMALFHIDLDSIKYLKASRQKMYKSLRKKDQDTLKEKLKPEYIEYILSEMKKKENN